MDKKRFLVFIAMVISHAVELQDRRKMVLDAASRSLTWWIYLEKILILHTGLGIYTNSDNWLMCLKYSSDSVVNGWTL